jgi:hypothetical protein
VRPRFAVAVYASVTALGAMPAAASACPSLAGVKSFHGHAHMAFDAQASGPDDPSDPNSRTETVTLDRSLASLDIKLTHKDVTRSGAVIFHGKASGGAVSINDTFDESGDSSIHSLVHYEGGLRNQLPSFGGATLFLYPKGCKYQLTVGFNLRAQSSGEIYGSSGVGGGAYSHTKHIPASLKLGGTAAPDAYYGCPYTLTTGSTSCYEFSGGFATDFMTLFQCHSAQAVNCSSSDGPVGVATFAWHLEPSFKKKK